MIEENQKERFEKIKNLFNSSSFVSEFDGRIKVGKNFIEDFRYLINLVDLLDKRNHIESINKIEKLKPIKEYEMYSFNDIIKTLCENREKINEIISKISE